MYSLISRAAAGLPNHRVSAAGHASSSGTSVRRSQRLRSGGSDRQDRAVLGQRVGEVDRDYFPLRVLETFGAQSHIGFIRYPSLHPHVVVVAVDVAGVRLERQGRLGFVETDLGADTIIDRLPPIAGGAEIFRPLLDDVMAIVMSFIY